MERTASAGCRDAWYRNFFEDSGLPAIICDRESLLILDANLAMLQQYGYTNEALHELRLGNLLANWNTASNGMPQRCALRRQDGSIAHVDVYPAGTANGTSTAAFILQDAAATPSASSGRPDDRACVADEEIRRLAYYDTITSLANRNLFDVVFSQRLADAQHGGQLALLIVNLLHFRDVNYTLGHATGDTLLRQMAERIQGLLGEHDFAGRVGSRFPVLLYGKDKAQAITVARALHRALEKPFNVGGIAYEVGAHIGMALMPGQGRDYGTLLRKADVALYQAAQNGLNLAVYDEALDPYTPERLALIGDFRRAIERRDIKLYCQPKVEMRTGTVVGAEALVRWDHPTLGSIRPDVFVPLIESTELIHVLTEYMLKSAVEQYQMWRADGITVPLAVNLSARDIAAMDLAGQLQNLLDAHDAAPDAIGLEVTESAVMRNPVTSIAELRRLSDMGFRLYVDDFGTGYSSLNYLTRLPVQVIKIDHGFTMTMVQDRRVAAIVRSTIQLAHDLDMQVVAEGTADSEIWAALAAMDCDEAQGYLIAQPFPAENLRHWLQQAPYSLPSTAHLRH